MSHDDLKTPVTVNATIKNPNELVAHCITTFKKVVDQRASETNEESILNGMDNSRLIVGFLGCMIDWTTELPKDKIELVRELQRWALDDEDGAGIIAIDENNADEFLAAIDEAEKAGSPTLAWKGNNIPLAVASNLAGMVRAQRAQEQAKATKH